MSKSQKITLIFIAVVLIIVGGVELLKYYNRQLAMSAFKQSMSTSKTSAQELALFNNLKTELQRNRSIFSFSNSSASDKKTQCLFYELSAINSQNDYNKMCEEDRACKGQNCDICAKRDNGMQAKWDDREYWWSKWESEGCQILGPEDLLMD